jgi:hypothetical protein
MVSAADHPSPKDEDIHFGSEEAIESFSRAAHDRFIFVETGIQDNRDACEVFEGRDEGMVEGIGILVHGLKTT